MDTESTSRLDPEVECCWREYKDEAGVPYVVSSVAGFPTHETRGDNRVKHARAWIREVLGKTKYKVSKEQKRAKHSVRTRRYRQRRVDMGEHECNRCKKRFGSRHELTRHEKRKYPCKIVSNTATDATDETDASATDTDTITDRDDTLSLTSISNVSNIAPSAPSAPPFSDAESTISNFSTNSSILLSDTSTIANENLESPRKKRRISRTDTSLLHSSSLLSLNNSSSSSSSSNSSNSSNNSSSSSSNENYGIEYDPNHSINNISNSNNSNNSNNVFNSDILQPAINNLPDFSEIFQASSSTSGPHCNGSVPLIADVPGLNSFQHALNAHGSQPPGNLINPHMNQFNPEMPKATGGVGRRDSSRKSACNSNSKQNATGANSRNESSCGRNVLNGMHQKDFGLAGRSDVSNRYDTNFDESASNGTVGHVALEDNEQSKPWSALMSNHSNHSNDNTNLRNNHHNNNWKSSNDRRRSTSNISVNDVNMMDASKNNTADALNNSNNNNNDDRSHSIDMIASDGKQGDGSNKANQSDFLIDRLNNTNLNININHQGNAKHANTSANGNETKNNKINTNIDSNGSYLMNVVPDDELSNQFCFNTMNLNGPDGSTKTQNVLNVDYSSLPPLPNVPIGAVLPTTTPVNDLNRLNNSFDKLSASHHNYDNLSNFNEHSNINNKINGSAASSNPMQSGGMQVDHTAHNPDNSQQRRQNASAGRGDKLRNKSEIEHEDDEDDEDEDIDLQLDEKPSKRTNSNKNIRLNNQMNAYNSLVSQSQRVDAIADVDEVSMRCGRSTPDSKDVRQYASGNINNCSNYNGSESIKNANIVQNEQCRGDAGSEDIDMKDADNASKSDLDGSGAREMHNSVNMKRPYAEVRGQMEEKARRVLAYIKECQHFETLNHDPVHVFRNTHIKSQDVEQDAERTIDSIDAPETSHLLKPNFPQRVRLYDLLKQVYPSQEEFNFVKNEILQGEWDVSEEVSDEDTNASKSNENDGGVMFDFDWDLFGKIDLITKPDCLVLRGYQRIILDEPTAVKMVFRCLNVNSRLLQPQMLPRALHEARKSQLRHIWSDVTACIKYTLWDDLQAQNDPNYVRKFMRCYGIQVQPGLIIVALAHYGMELYDVVDVFSHSLASFETLVHKRKRKALHQFKKNVEAEYKRRAPDFKHMIIFICYQVLDIVRACHKVGIWPLDTYPDNFFFCPRRWRLVRGDYGEGVKKLRTTLKMPYKVSLPRIIPPENDDEIIDIEAATAYESGRVIELITKNAFSGLRTDGCEEEIYGAEIVECTSGLCAVKPEDRDSIDEAMQKMRKKFGDLVHMDGETKKRLMDWLRLVQVDDDEWDLD